MKNVMTQSDVQEMITEILEVERIGPVEPVVEPKEFFGEAELEPISEIKTFEPEEIDEAASDQMQKHAKVIYKMTDYNDHQGALLYLAQKVLKDKRFTKITKALQDLHNALGGMPPELGSFRSKFLYPVLMDLAKKKLSPEDFDAIHNSF